MLIGFRVGEQKNGDPAPVGDSVRVLTNRYVEPTGIALAELRGSKWITHIDTRTASGRPRHAGEPRGEPYTVTGCSMAVLAQASA